MKFHYVASTEQGKVIENNQDAKDTTELLSILASKGLKPISITKLKQGQTGKSSKKIFGKKVTLTDKIFLTKYLSIMLKVGIDLFQAINILLADFKKTALRALLLEVKEALEQGRPFYSTFAKYPQHFSQVFVNLVKAGEKSGNLEGVFTDLNVDLTKEKALRAKIKGALTYPTLLFALSIIILIFLATFALPKLAGVFLGGGIEPPLFSRIVFGVGLFINKYIWVFVGSIVVLIVGSIAFARSTPGKRFFSKALVKVPVVRKVAYHMAIQRFADTLSSLLKSGIPIIDALKITADAVGYVPIKEALNRIADEGVAKGLSLGDAFRKETVFPFVVTNLVAISEQAGHLDEVLETLGQFYETEIESAIKSAVTFIEPVLLLFIGGVIGTIALAIIVPVYQLVGQL